MGWITPVVLQLKLILMNFAETRVNSYEINFESRKYSFRTLVKQSESKLTATIILWSCCAKSIKKITNIEQR